MHKVEIATPQDVLRNLALTDEQITDLRREQDKALKVFRSKARLTPKERMLGYAVEMERHHRQTGNKDALAEAVAIQGRYREAAEIAVNPELIVNFTEKADAIEKPDVNCECPDHAAEGDLHIPNQFIQANVISIKHGGELMPAIRCRVCNDLNVRSIPPHLAEQKAARAHSVANENNQVKADQFFRQKR